MPLKPDVARKLLATNRAFYERFAREFVETRAAPQPGFFKLLDHLPRPCETVLDVGCGDGRLGRFLIEQVGVEQYVGVDFSREMVARGAADERMSYKVIDISQPGFLKSMGRFDVIACLATLQHIPDREVRAMTLAEMGRHLGPAGRLVMSNWQFLESERQRAKIVPWPRLELGKDEVEPGDHLLTWKRGGFGLRYVALIDAAETAELAGRAGLRVVGQFRSDGREGNLNLYSICARLP